MNTHTPPANHPSPLQRLYREPLCPPEPLPPYPDHDPQRTERLADELLRRFAVLPGASLTGLTRLPSNHGRHAVRQWLLISHPPLAYRDPTYPEWCQLLEAFGRALQRLAQPL
ncbi:MAG TPA: hypothetical protein VFA75_21395 [Nevskia sp.]|nr:hypothetical protein [Nevskia sp.]